MHAEFYNAEGPARSNSNVIIPATSNARAFM